MALRNRSRLRDGLRRPGRCDSLARTPRSTPPGEGCRAGRGSRRRRALAAARARTPAGDDLWHGAGYAPRWGALVERAQTQLDLASAAVWQSIIRAAEYVWRRRLLFHCCTGVIEGMSRYVVRDRMESTGARWRLVGVEVLLKPRAPRASRVSITLLNLHCASTSGTTPRDTLMG